MTYTSILTKTGTSPFKRSELPPTAPNNPLRVTEGATLIEFSHQPTMVIAQRIAPAYRFILWATSTVQFHEDDWAERIEIETTEDFNELIRDLASEAQQDELNAREQAMGTAQRRGSLDFDTLNAKGQAVRDRWEQNAEHDSALLESGPVYPKDNQAECPSCGQDNFRAVGNGKFECGNCDYYTEC